MKQTHIKEHCYNIFHLGMVDAYPNELVNMIGKGRIKGYYTFRILQQEVKESYEKYT